MERNLFNHFKDQQLYIFGGIGHRIFGNDNSSNEAYRKIDEFIQDRLQNWKYII